MKSYNHTIEYYGISDVGRIRSNNEDAFVAQQLWDDDNVLAVAIDGVGGYEGGEVAADMARSHIVDYLTACANGEREMLLKQAVVDANNAISAARELDRERAQMGCVLSAAIFDNARKLVFMAHMGDTRFYQFWNGRLVKLSHDHSLVGYREEMGDLTEAEAMAHPQRNIISRVVGLEHLEADTTQIECATYEMLPEGLYLLCSDGLTDLVTSAQITEILRQSVSLEVMASQLIDAANAQGGKDNVTVVLVRTPAEEGVTVAAKGQNGRTKGRSNPASDVVQNTSDVVQNTTEDEPRDAGLNMSEMHDRASAERASGSTGRTSRIVEGGVYLGVVVAISAAAFFGYRAHNLQLQNSLLMQRCDSLSAIIRCLTTDTVRTATDDSLELTTVPESADSAAISTPTPPPAGPKEH